MTQTEMLLDHFHKVGNISGIEAGALYRIRSLGRRINDLEERGFEFARVRRVDPTGRPYTRYYFLGKQGSIRLRKAA